MLKTIQAHTALYKMESIEYEFINRPVELSKIKSDYDANNKVYFSIEKTAQADQVYFFNPEFAFEKQLLVNADAAKIFTYMKAAEKFKQEFQKFERKGFVFIKIDNKYLNIFVHHLSE